MVKVVMGVQFSLLALFRVEYSGSGGESQGLGKTNAPRDDTSKNGNVGTDKTKAKRAPTLPLCIKCLLKLMYYVV